MENITETNTSAVNSETKNTSRLNFGIRRKTDDKIIGGVCSGIADYYDIDPVIVRLIAAAGFLMFGVGPLVYLLLWIILPVSEVSSRVIGSTEGLNPVR